MTYERYQNGTSAAGNGSPSSREIQSDVLQIRGEMSKTLEEITSKLVPKELLSELVHAITGGGGARFMKGMSSSIGRNPIPFALIAGGVGYLIYQQAQDDDVDGSMRTMELAGQARDGARKVAQRATDAAKQAAETTRNVAHRSQDIMHKGQDMLREQPLVLAGLGIALGAAIAGAAPLSRREQELMGEPAGELMGELQERAHQLKDRVEKGVRAAGDAAKQALTETTDRAKDGAGAGPDTQG